MTRSRGIFIGLILLVIFVTGYFIFISRWVLKEAGSWLQEETVELGNLTIQSLAQGLKNPWERGEDLELNEVLYNVKKENSSIASCALINPEGTIIAHTDPNRVLSTFKFPEDIDVTGLKNNSFYFVGDTVYFFKSMEDVVGISLGSIFLKMTAYPIIRGKSAFNRIFFLLGFGTLIAFIVFGILVLVFSSPGEIRVQTQPPKTRDFLNETVPKRGGRVPENYSHLLYDFSTDIPRSTYKFFQLSQSKWGFYHFYLTSGGYGWYVLQRVLDEYFKSHLFLKDNPRELMEELFNELSFLPLKEAIAEGILLIFDEEKREVRASGTGHGYLQLLGDSVQDILPPTSVYNLSQKSGEIQDAGLKIVNDPFLYLSGPLIRWERLGEWESHLRNIRDPETGNEVLERFNMDVEMSKPGEPLFWLWLKRKLEPES